MDLVVGDNQSESHSMHLQNKITSPQSRHHLSKPESRLEADFFGSGGLAPGTRTRMGCVAPIVDGRFRGTTFIIIIIIVIIVAPQAARCPRHASTQYLLY